MEGEHKITCPQCGHNFDIESVLTEKIEKSFRDKYNSLFQVEKKKLNEALIAEKQKIEQQEQLLNREKENLDNTLKTRLNEARAEQEKLIRSSINEQYENQMRLLMEQKQEDAKKIGKLLETQIENEKLKQTLENQEKTLRLELEKQLTETLKTKTREMIEKETEQLQLNVKEKETTISQLTLQIDEMKRRAEQGSMQLQGEAQELLLEEALIALFPFDSIDEVGKGVKGADVIQTVRNRQGQECGKIAWESKRTKHWSNEWIKKIKEDQGRVKADICVIVTEVLPEGINKMGLIEDVYVCSFSDFKGLAIALRDGIIRVNRAFAGQTNKGEKMQMLYDYLTGNEFKLQMNTIVQGFRTLKEGYEKEKVQMHRIWKEREKQLDRILINTNEFLGSLEGIAGQHYGNLGEADTPAELNAPED